MPPRIVHPRLAPIVGTDAQLPALPPHALTPDALRARFAQAPHHPAWQPEFSGDGRFFTERPLSDAAVLIALLPHADGLRVLLTRRSEQLRGHAGQISFPGGRSEATDADPAATALREAHEEVGLAPDRAEVIGQLPVYTTVTSYVVTPVVALVQAPWSLDQLAVDPSEVAEAFEVPLAFLMDPANHQRHRYSDGKDGADGSTRHFLSMPWHGTGTSGGEREHFIWGATAAMLRNLYRFLAG